MFKKILYLISLLLGFTIILKIFGKYRNVNEVKYLKEDTEQKQRRDLKGLNDRQLEIFRLIEKRKVLLPSDIYSLHPQVSTRTLRRDMTTLVSRNIVKQEGSTKDTRYILLE